jgi:hypothetical protein
LQVPIVSSLRELDSAPRRFLLFIAFNVVSWQCIIGPALVLLARKIDMPPSWVGFLNSFTPLSTILVVLTVQLITRLGSKPVMLFAWLLRNLITCTVFFLPWAMLHYGQRAGWYVLMASTLGFCLMRAIGAGGWFPWLHEVVPAGQRAAYFTTEASVTHLLNVLVAFGIAWILHGDPSINRFLAIYAIGILSGFGSLTWMSRVPGGRGVNRRMTFRDVYEPYRTAIRDRRFLIYVITASLCFSSLSWLGSALVLYMRDALGMSARSIMMLTATGSIGILFTIRYWGRFAEYAGSGSTMFLALTAHGIMALSFIALSPGAVYTLYALAPVYVLICIFSAAFWTSAHRAMLNLVHEESRVGYSNIWTVGTSIACGITPILVGLAIDHLNLWGFRLCFAMSGLVGLGCAIACKWVVQDGRSTVKPQFRVITPAMTVETLMDIARITIGRHESARTPLTGKTPRN